MFALSHKDAHGEKNKKWSPLQNKSQFFSDHLKATLLEMLLGHWANKGQGGYEIVCLTGPFPCVSLQRRSHIHIHSQFIYIAVPFSLLVSVTNYK